MPSDEIVETYRKALYRARIEADKMKIELVKAQLRAEILEEENEALRDYVAFLAKSVA